ncbi:MAG: response regulator transcription factor, partial [Rhodothermales bacterium]|nr:response regulator transcription factor [Rhodothermales bacterium]
DSHQDRVAALAAGADDCLARPFDLDELSARVHALLRRSEVQNGTNSRTVGSMQLDHATRKVKCCGHTFDLSTREFDLLLYFASRPQRVITRDEILFDVWGPEFDGNTNVVDVYVGYLRRKLSGAHCAHRIETVRGAGYRYVVERREPRPPSRSTIACPFPEPA